MKILHLYKSFYPETYGGIEHFIYTLSEATDKLGAKNSLFTTSHDLSINLEYDFLNITRFKTTLDKASCPISYTLARNFKKLSATYDIIHLHFPWPFADLLTLLNQDKPLVITYHSDIIKQKIIKKFYRPLMKNLFQRANCIITTSHNLLESSIDLKNHKQKCKVIPLGLNLNQINLASAELITKWRKQVGEEFLLFIGQFRYYKGLDTLVEALIKYPVPTVFIGDGDKKNHYINTLKKAGVKNIHFVGSIFDDDKSALLSLCKAVVLPSIVRSEAFGISLLEGAAAGKALISTELQTGTSFANIHNETGIVVAPQNSAALAKAIEKIFSDRQLCQQYAKNAKERAHNLFSIDQVANKYLSVYKKII